MSFWDEQLGRYVCPVCGHSRIKVGAVMAKTVYIDYAGQIIDDEGQSETEFIGPWECLNCGHEELTKEDPA